jgi:diguanylate cyclase (GGDEF)-like protein
MRLSLKTRILLLIAGTVTGLAAIILFALSTLMGREIEGAVRNDVNATGGVLAQFMSVRSATLLSQSQLLARQPALKNYIFSDRGRQQSDYATTSDYAHDVLASMHADAALITDQDGRVQGDSEKRIPDRTDLAREPGIAAALGGRNWTGIVARADHLLLQISVPVTVAGYVKGTLTAYSAIDASVAKELKRALGTEVAFVQNGRVMAASMPLAARIPTPQGAPQVVTLHSLRYYALYDQLAGTRRKDKIGFVVLRPYAQAMAQYQRLHTAFIFISIVALLLSLAVGAAVAGGIIRPLDGVVDAARVLQQGEWPERFVEQRNDEIGLLQTAFNEMTASIRASQERLLSLIDTDPLTEVDNHRRFHERLHQEAKRCAASGEALSLLLIDLDHFQQFNQLHGRTLGDQALKQVAIILRNCLSEVAILARYGGKEFAALLPQQDLEHAEQLAERIRATVQQHWSTAGDEKGLTVSIGCAEFNTQTTHDEGLVLAAELAVSQAKQLGRNRICRFDNVPGADEMADPFQLHRSLNDGSFATIQALAAAVDAKDPYTQGHSQRVATYARDLARAIGLSEEMIELIYITGTLHDVGKIGVPDAILKKPGRLDDDERAIMETHPVLGEVIVRKVPRLASTLPGVRNHHERWDGKGYPDHLTGEKIPHMARILAVADTFDAMTSDRPYRKGLAWEVALAEIAKGAGTQFDPALASAFVELMRAREAQPKAA